MSLRHQLIYLKKNALLDSAKLPENTKKFLTWWHSKHYPFVYPRQANTASNEVQIALTILIEGIAAC